MNFIGSAIRRPVTVCMITIGVLAFGTIALKKLPINLLPELAYPTLTLETRYPGAAPEEVEYLVTRPIEEAVAVIPQKKRIHSSSKPELSQVTIEFEWGRQMDFAILDVSKKVDLLRLPDDVEKPRILRYDPNQDPIMKVSVTSPDMALTELRYFAEEDLKKRLDGIAGLASVKIIGGEEEVIEVSLDEAALKRFGLEIDTVAERLRQENINRAGGSLYENEARYLVRTLNEFRDVEDIGRTIVARTGDRKIYLKEVATIEYGHRDRDLIARLGGEEGIELAFYKEGDANTVQVSRLLQAAIEKYDEEFKDRVSLTTTFDGASFIQDSIHEVVLNAVLGGLIAILVLFSFLRDFKGTLIVALSIPVSVFTTFFLMLQFGVSLNVMSLGGLALGIGMLVDNSIVVLESIFVRKKLGEADLEASRKGTSTVSGAVTASTLTTIVVFLPIVFIKGVGGQLFKDLGLTVSFALLASLAASLTLIPTLYALFARRKRKKEASEVPAEEVDRGELQVPKNWYARFLTGALRLRYLVVLIAAVVVFQGALLQKKMPVNLIPEMSQGEYFVLLEMNEGTPIETSDREAAWIEEQLRQMDAIDVVFATVGQFSQGVEERSGENLAQINFSLKKGIKDPDAVIAAVRQKLSERRDLNFQIGTPSYFSFRPPIEIEVYLEDQDKLAEITRALVADLEALNVLRDIHSTVAEGNPEVQIRFQRETMSKMGLSIGQVAQMLRDKIQGTTPTRFVRSGRDLDIVVRLRESDRSQLEQVENLTVGYREGRPIFLSSIADVQTQVGPSQIKRVAQKRCSVISADILGHDLRGVTEMIRPIKHEYEQRYSDVTIRETGQDEDRREAFQSLWFVIGLAIFLVYLVMASQFESLLHPFLILFTVPIGLVGGLAALFFCGMELSVIALIGLVMLAGIVVNNAIVLVDYINQLRRRGVPVYDSLIIAANRRFRPIMMTTATTVLGLVPMALGLGEGAEMRTPLAISVIGGLLFSTLLTLVLIPVLYGIVSRNLNLPGGDPPAEASAEAASQEAPQ